MAVEDAKVGAPGVARACRRRSRTDSRIDSESRSPSTEAEEGEPLLPSKGDKLSKPLLAPRRLDFTIHPRSLLAKAWQLAGLTARAAVAATLFALLNFVITFASRSLANAAVAITAVLLLVAGGWFATRTRRQRDPVLPISPTRSRTSPKLTAAPPPPPSDHPYYDEIAVARTLFLQGRSDVLQGRNEHPLAKEREARERAKLYRSHDPRRFRIAPA